MPSVPAWQPWVAPALAAALAAVAGFVGWRGGDLAAQVDRIGLFHRQGLTLWDSQWYGGHWTLDYSVIFPPVAGTIGLHATEILSVAVASLAFDRIIVAHFGPGARFGSFAFAAGTLVPVAVGQVPFLLGEACALAGLWAATRGRWPAAVLLSVAASLASPLAGAFAVLALATWLLADWPQRRLGIVAMMAGAVVPVAALSLVFPGQGRMPFPAVDFLAEGTVFAAATLMVPRDERVLWIGARLYLVAFVLSFVVPSALAGNIERLGETIGAPLLLCILWSSRRLVIAALVIPLVLMQWGQAAGALTTDNANPSSHPQFFAPLLRYVIARDEPLGRVEIVPTALHWEAAYVAPSLPLARGWERQLDTADNPIFYTRGALTPASYRGWLLDNGVRYVALPDVTLDYAAVAEGDLVRAGVPGLRLVWRNPNWRVYLVQGSPGLVTGPATVTSLDGGGISLNVTTPGMIQVRERYSPKWAIVQGSGCTNETSDGWLSIEALTPGPLRAALRLVGPPGDPC